MTKTQADTLIAILTDLAEELHGDKKLHTKARIAALRDDLEAAAAERNDPRKV